MIKKLLVLFLSVGTLSVAMNNITELDRDEFPVVREDPVSTTSLVADFSSTELDAVAQILENKKFYSYLSQSEREFRAVQAVRNGRVKTQ